MHDGTSNPPVFRVKTVREHKVMNVRDPGRKTDLPPGEYQMVQKKGPGGMWLVVRALGVPEEWGNLEGLWREWYPGIEEVKLEPPRPAA